MGPVLLGLLVCLSRSSSDCLVHPVQMTHKIEAASAMVLVDTELGSMMLEHVVEMYLGRKC